MTKTIFIDARYTGEISLNEDITEFIKETKIKSIALFASVQFLNLKKVESQLVELGIKVNITKAKRAAEKIQILGCDVYGNSFKDKIIEKSDLILYIGDGEFHAKALLISQIYSGNVKDVIVYNPVSGKMKVMGIQDVEVIINKLRSNLRKFVNSSKVGIIVSTKPGQSYLELAEKLKKQLEKQGKKIFVFVDDNINLSCLEDFNFIEVWVNSACPRIGFDDLTSTNSVVVNVKEAFEPLVYLEKLEKLKV
ncbi:MAG: diphthamide synthesis protein [Candidatus Pacearchaeota archaeon]|jgi:2-(3-amino-3-carboxypropyl)histidine synthase